MLGLLPDGSNKNQQTPEVADFPGQKLSVTIYGNLEQFSQGVYCESSDTFNGKAIGPGISCLYES